MTQYSLKWWRRVDPLYSCRKRPRRCNELLITPRHVGIHDIETVAVSRVQEFFHKVGNVGWVTYGDKCAETDAVDEMSTDGHDRSLSSVVETEQARWLQDGR